MLSEQIVGKLNHNATTHIGGDLATVAKPLAFAPFFFPLGLPFIVVVVTIAVDKTSYGGKH